MSKSGASKLAGSMWATVSKHGSQLLTGLGIAGFFVAGGMAVGVTPKAVLLVEEEKRRRNERLAREAEAYGCDEYEPVTELKPMDTVKLTWKCYIPAIVVALASSACVIGASSANVRRNAALAAAYALSETTMKEYKDKVLETIGEKKEQGIRDAIAKDKVEQNPPNQNTIIITEKGNTLCLDVISGRYFRSDRDKLDRAVNELNRRMRDEMYISVNEFYDEIGLEQIAVGHDVGWNIDRGLIDLEYSAQLTPDGTPCMVISYAVSPKWDFRR